MTWSFEKAAKKFYSNVKVYKDTLKNIYNNGKAQNTTTGWAVYALYLNGKLKKIGKAVCNKGLFTRMSQYYRLTKEGCKRISNSNRNKVKVEYFFCLSSKIDCWIAERKMQVDAWDNGETMPWENKTRN